MVRGAVRSRRRCRLEKLRRVVANHLHLCWKIQCTSHTAYHYCILETRHHAGLASATVLGPSSAFFRLFGLDRPHTALARFPCTSIPS